MTSEAQNDICFTDVRQCNTAVSDTMFALLGMDAGFLLISYYKPNLLAPPHSSSPSPGRVEIGAGPSLGCLRSREVESASLAASVIFRRNSFKPVFSKLLDFTLFQYAVKALIWMCRQYCHK